MGSISPEITAFAAPVTFAAPSGSDRYRPLPSRYVSRIQRTSSTRRPIASSAGTIPSFGEVAMPVSTIAGSGASTKKL
ncbi:hypothetical protein [Streptomyces sp. IBSBF 2394]|uniref:hypothetical protein n=1 Tax=Streptomyces sp. IBSBF 2394 TaxID=2903532 RepID=UPI002FDBE0FA